MLAEAIEHHAAELEHVRAEAQEAVDAATAERDAAITPGRGGRGRGDRGN